MSSPKMSSPKKRVVYEFDAAPEDLLWSVYRRCVEQEPEMQAEAKLASEQMSMLPYDELDKRQEDIGAEQFGEAELVARRTAPNPLDIFKGSPPKAVADPALRNNPLRGRHMVLISSTALLSWVFLQTLMYAYISVGEVYDPANTNYGPSGAVLQILGALDTNLIRAGELPRLFWSCFMHSGWLHIGMNVICQMQYLIMFEPDWGFWRVAIIFYGSCIAGNLVSSISDPCTVTVGSSGGLFGLMAATVPYCIEYWKTIPRPLGIVIMTIIVVIVTLAMGFNNSGTDNWAHMGGFCGGTCLGFATIGNVNICVSSKKQNVQKIKKKRIKKFALFRRFQNVCNAGCKCGVREWIIRIIGICGYITEVTMGSHYLFVDQHFQPVGGLTYHGKQECCCCIPKIKPSGLLPPDMKDDKTYEDVYCSPCRGPNGFAHGYKYPVVDPDKPTMVQRSWPCSWVRHRLEWEEDWDPWDPNTQVSWPRKSISDNISNGGQGSFGGGDSEDVFTNPSLIGDREVQNYNVERSPDDPPEITFPYEDMALQLKQLISQLSR